MARKSCKAKSSDTEPKSEDQPARKALPAIRPELLEELLAAAGPDGLTGKDGLLRQLTAALLNRALEAEMSDHLGYESKEEPPEEQLNRGIYCHRRHQAPSGINPPLRPNTEFLTPPAGAQRASAMRHAIPFDLRPPIASFSARISTASERPPP